MLRLWHVVYWQEVGAVSILQIWCNLDLFAVETLLSHQIGLLLVNDELLLVIGWTLAWMNVWAWLTVLMDMNSSSDQRLGSFRVWNSRSLVGIKRHQEPIRCQRLRAVGPDWRNCVYCFTLLLLLRGHPLDEDVLPWVLMVLQLLSYEVRWLRVDWCL